MEDAFEILVHLVVPETQDPIALAGEVIVPLRVALGVHLKIVLTTVDLDDEPMLEAQEIQDVAVERCLAAEVISPSFSTSEDGSRASPPAASFACAGCARSRWP